MRNQNSLVQTKIDTQMSVANIVLSKLELLDRNCIIAGGAPRDWYLGNLATDIDVYLHYPIWTTVRQRVGLLNELGLTVQSKHENWEVNEIYQTNHHIKQLYNCELLGEKIQVMFVDEPTFTSVVDTFPISISKAWYKKGTIGTTQDFKDSVKYKILWKTVDNYKEDDKYITKIKAKFSDYLYIPKEELVSLKLVKEVINNLRDSKILELMSRDEIVHWLLK